MYKLAFSDLLEIKSFPWIGISFYSIKAVFFCFFFVCFFVVVVVCLFFSKEQGRVLRKRDTKLN